MMRSMVLACMLLLLLPPPLRRFILMRRYKWPDEEYRGQWVAGHMQVMTCDLLRARPFISLTSHITMLQGLGVFIMRDGSRYIGEFYADKFCGRGRIESTNGDAHDATLPSNPKP
jgi:hypothetical protein